MANKVEVTRIFNAPVEMVWKLWTDPELVKRWWGPKQFTSPVAKIDFREGGKSIVSMKAPVEFGGQEYFSSWVYQKISLLQEIEFIQTLCDSVGNKIAPTSVGMPEDFPKYTRTVVTFFSEKKGITRMTITEHAEFGSISEKAQIGLEQVMDKMVAIFAKN